MKEHIKRMFEKSGINIMVILGFAGVLLLSADSIFPESKNKTTAEYSLETYRTQLETNLEQLLSAVSGAGDVKVMITLESGQENIYAWQEKTTQDEQSVSADVNGQQSNRYTYENEIVLVNEGSEKQALVEKTMEPVVQGVVVVCAGADDIKVVSDITNAVSVALNVTSNRICVIKMK